jgi:3-methyladenine DNA glycosylase AlkC
MKAKIVLKDILFNQAKFALIASQIKAVYADFSCDDFIDEILKNYQNLELKQRILLIAKILQKYLPKNYEKALEILLKSLPRPLNPSLQDNDFGDFIYASYSEFIAQNGCKKQYLEISLNALKQVTMRFSAEYAIRDFLNNFPNETLEFLKNCSLDKNYHVRRLASEGLRPKLPWGKKINICYKKAAEILNNLYFDNCRFVVRSSANHLNDIAKIDAEFAINILKTWQKQKKASEKELNFIISHSLRSLVKQGDKQALQMLGINDEVDFEISDFFYKKNVKLGENLEFSFDLMAKKDVKAIINYKIYFQTKAQKLGIGKVFLTKKCNLRVGEKINLSKKHLIKNLTTRKIYLGVHKLEILVNGKVLQREFFDVF